MTSSGMYTFVLAFSMAVWDDDRITTTLCSKAGVIAEMAIVRSVQYVTLVGYNFLHFAPSSPNYGVSRLLVIAGD